MKPIQRLVLIISIVTTGMTIADENQLAKLSPVPFTQVAIDDSFWTPRLETTRDITLPHCLDWCEKTGRIGNFAKAGGSMEGQFEGIYFNDSDVHKVLEGAAYILALYPSDELRETIEQLVTTILSAQQSNGYLNTYYTLVEPDKRWTDLEVKHELYCAGHLFEAAVACFDATGKYDLLNCACRFADLIDSIFGPEKRHGVPGHEEIELALIKLYHLTGQRRYLDLAEFFIEERGKKQGSKQIQDHLPVREQTEVFGHAVRAMYLYSGVADLVKLNDDAGYLQAMEAIWNDLVNHKMYVTGGIGVSGHGEGFSAGYDLPNEQAYAETCASIALAFYSHRLALLHADARYADVFERVLYNGLLSGISLDGDKFFYVNPLASRRIDPADFKEDELRNTGHHRQYWFGCACCPSNMVRFLPTIGSYAYAHSDTAIYANLYMNADAAIALRDSIVTLKQTTRYPWDGAIRIEVRPSVSCQFDVNLRIPGWCDKPGLRVNGRKTALAMHKGYTRITRQWKKGDTIQLDLPMTIRRIESHPGVKNNTGKIALQRGPIVYCLESQDNQDLIPYLAISRQVKLNATYHPDLLNGVTVITGQAVYHTDPYSDVRLYRPAAEPETIQFTAIPYYAWDNREPGDMTVWIPEDLALAPAVTFLSTCKITASYTQDKRELSALNDGIDPANSNDHRIPRFTWWNHRGTEEWVQYEFTEPHPVSGVEVYWFDDEKNEGKCRAPESWTLLYKDGEEWKTIEGEYGVEPDRFNRVTFPAVRTSGLRIEVELQPDYSAGILEWRVLR